MQTLMHIQPRLPPPLGSSDGGVSGGSAPFRAGGHRLRGQRVRSVGAPRLAGRAADAHNIRGHA